MTINDDIIVSPNSNSHSHSIARLSQIVTSDVIIARLAKIVTSDVIIARLAKIVTSNITLDSSSYTA